MKEYAYEDGRAVDLEPLRNAPYMSDRDYANAHRSLVLACHDIILNYNGGALFSKRQIYPAKGILWPIGGRVKKGIPIEDSMRLKAKEECGLDVFGLTKLDVERTFWRTAPFSHGHGTDTINVMYYGEGEGTLKLNFEHETARTVMPEEYTPEFRRELHPYVQNFMDRVMELMRKERADEQD